MTNQTSFVSSKSDILFVVIIDVDSVIHAGKKLG